MKRGARRRIFLLIGTLALMAAFAAVAAAGPAQEILANPTAPEGAEMEEGKVEKVLSRIQWLGHDTFLIDADKRIYTDPYQLAGGPPADIILITHDHFDHCSPDDVAKIQNAGTTIVATADCAGKLTGKVQTVRPGEKLSVEGVEIEAVPAYNLDKKFHPKASGWVGYVFSVEGVRIYLAGDTDFIPEMKDVRCDIALLPVSGTYVMTADEAVQAALVIKPKVAVPMHYGAIVGSAKDAEHFKKALEGKVEVRILPRKQGVGG